MRIATFEDLMAILKNRIQIAKAGKYRLKVTSASPYHDNGEDKVICNFNAMTTAHITGWEIVDDEGTVTKAKSIQELVEEGNFDDAANRNLSSGQRVGRDYVPSKGEIVDVMVEKTTTKSGVTGLFVSSVTPVPVEASSKVNLENMFKDVAPNKEEEVEVEPEVEKVD